MADLSQFRSSGTTYDFSKGPKSLYYANGDEDLLGIIYNVPQTDDDDEWGGTERIAVERLADTIGTLQEEVEDPHGTGTAGLLNRATALEILLDTTTPKLTLGSLVLNGSTNQIAIGSDTTLDSQNLVLDAVFELDYVSPTDYRIKYRDVTITMTQGASKQIAFQIGSANYFFGEVGLSLPALTLSGDLTISGDIAATNGVFSNAIVVDDITMNTLQASTLDVTTATFCGDITLEGQFKGNLDPENSTTRNIGNPTYRWGLVAAAALNLTGDVDCLDIRTTGTLTVGTSTTVGGHILPDANEAYNIGDASTPMRFNGIAAATLRLSSDLYASDLYVNDIACHDILSNDFVAASATICGALSAESLAVSGAGAIGTTLSTGSHLTVTGNLFVQNIIPDADNLRHLGSGTYAWQDIYLYDSGAAAVVQVKVVSGAWVIT